jgi:hypothetical protein
MSENAIQRQILDALACVGAHATRVQSGKVKVRGGWMQLAQEGTADIHVTVPPRGLTLWLEVKTGEGKLRAVQVAWAEGQRGLGAVVRTVRTPAEAVRAYLDAKAIPGAAS